MHGANVAKNADATLRKCAVAVDGAVVIATPVDTGRARSNWQVGLDAPVAGTIEPLAKGTASTQASINAAKAEIAQYDGARNKELHITNNLTYIGRLNEGWSAQAPAAFVEKAVMVGINAVRGAKLLGTSTTQD